MKDGQFSFEANTNGKWETLAEGIDATYLSTEKRWICWHTNGSVRSSNE
jgi:hypothetical protein